MIGLRQTVDESTLADNVQAAADYLRRRWDDFLNLGPRIVDLQHRAAVAAARARDAGDTERAELARDVIRRLGNLNVIHGRAVDTMRDVARYVGLGGYAGLGAIPAAQVTIITGLALTVVWFFRAYAAESRKLDMIEAGTLTPEQAVALDQSVGAGPGAVLSQVGGLAKLALFGVLAFFAWRIAETAGAFASNPPLVVFDKNPPDPDAEVFGEEVYAVWYRHADDGGNYIHEFGPDVQLYADADGSVSLHHRRGRRVWQDF